MAFWRGRKGAEPAPLKLVTWYALDREEAAERVQRWHAGADRRLAWLADVVGRQGLALEPRPEYLGSLWDWYVRWAQAPKFASDEPTPEWLMPLGQDDESWRVPVVPYTRDQAIGGDAVSTFYVEVLRVTVPKLKWTIERSGSDKNGPALVLPGHLRSPLFSPMHAHHIVRRAIENPSYGLVNVYEHAVSNVEELLRPRPEPRGDTVVYVETTEDPDYRWEVAVDDVTGHEMEDLVEEFVRALASVQGVSEVYHQDREQILVKGRVTKKALVAFSDEWWSHRVPEHRIES
jgi:hypothetical protein